MADTLRSDRSLRILILSAVALVKILNQRERLEVGLHALVERHEVVDLRRRIRERLGPQPRPAVGHEAHDLVVVVARRIDVHPAPRRHLDRQ
jgi:hypothetical protein